METKCKKQLLKRTRRTGPVKKFSSKLESDLKESTSIFVANKDDDDDDDKDDDNNSDDVGGKIKVTIFLLQFCGQTRTKVLKWNECRAKCGARVELLRAAKILQLKTSSR